MPAQLHARRVSNIRDIVLDVLKTADAVISAFEVERRVRKAHPLLPTGGDSVRNALYALWRAGKVARTGNRGRHGYRILDETTTSGDTV